MLSRKHFSAKMLAAAVALLAVSSASGSDYLANQQSGLNGRLESLTAAADHQEMVVSGMKALLAQGHAAPLAVNEAVNALETIQKEVALVRQMANDLKTVERKSDIAAPDTVVLPIPVLKDLHSSHDVSHVSFRLRNDSERKIANKIGSLLLKLHACQPTALHKALGERLSRLASLESHDKTVIRERELLSLRQKAYESETLADASALPILSNSTQEFAVGNRTIRGEESLIRLVSNSTNRLRFATRRSQYQQQAKLWRQKVAALQQLDAADMINLQEISHARSGQQYFSVLAAKGKATPSDYEVVLTSAVGRSSSVPAVLSELQSIAERNVQRHKRSSERCLSLTSLEQKLTRLAKQDDFSTGEVAAVRRALTVARTEAALNDHREAVQLAVVAFVESRASGAASFEVPTNEASTTQALRAVVELAADNRQETEFAMARVAVARSRANGMKTLHAEGYVSWWSAREVAARLEDLQTEARRQELIRQVNALVLQLVKDGEPIFAENQAVALSQ